MVLRIPKQVQALSSDFQPRYEPNFAASNALSLFLQLPGLRGLWTMAAISSAPSVIELAGYNRDLTYNGNPTFGSDGLAPCAILDGTGDFLSRADEAGLDIIGNESYIAAPGLTLGGWFKISSLGAVTACIGKYNTSTNQQSYIIRYTASGLPGMIVSTDGTTGVTGNSSVTATAGKWAFLVGRFTPSTEIAFWHNGTKDTNVVGIPATLFNSSAMLIIGAYNAGAAGLFTGSIGTCFLCASAISDVIVKNLYQQTRAMYGV